MNPLMFCQACTDYADCNLPTKGDVTKRSSVCTISTKESSSSWTVQSIDTPSHFNEFLVTGQYSDIFQDYDVCPQVIGTGNYGSVRECMNLMTGERFAVKTIDKSKIGRLDHLQREIELLQMMNHRSIMRLVDIYEDSDYVHIVTDKYSGGELFDKIINNTTGTGCLPEYEAARIIKSILEAVLYLHANGVVHRDIKPENILFESRQEGSPVKLIDFGLSRTHFPGEEPMRNAVGTAYYMSPEVIKGCYDRSCDLWSIGVVTYILLTGYPPFNGSNDSEIYASIMRGNLVFESKVWGGLSHGARDFVRRLLCRDSSLRSTAQEALQHPWILCHCY
jgi:serine/threonine protein kinase